MDPKIAKKTQDTLGKFIKKPPLTEKLLTKPPFRFLHDVMTSIIKTTGVMKGLFTESEMNSENVKDRDSKIAFLQKAVDYVNAASSKQLTVKPAKVVAGHEPEKTNEFLQALAQAISSKVNNEEVLDSMNNKGKSSKKEEKEEKPREREKSSDRRKKDEDKRSRDRGEEKERSRDREDRHKERSKDRDERHKDRDEKHKDREHRDREKDREREGRHKSGRSRHKKLKENEEAFDRDLGYRYTPDDIDSDVLLSDGEFDTLTGTGNATYVVDPSQEYRDQSPERPQMYRPIPRQVSTYQEMKRGEDSHEEGDLDVDLEDTDIQLYGRESGHKIERPKAARPRRGRAMTPCNGKGYEIPNEEPRTPYVSEDNSYPRNEMDKDNEFDDEMDAVVETSKPKKKKRIKSGKGEDSQPVTYSGKGKLKPGVYPKTSTPNSSPQSPKKDSKPKPYVNKITDKGKSPSHRIKDSELDVIKQSSNTSKLTDKRLPKKVMPINRIEKKVVANQTQSGSRRENRTEQSLKKMADAKKQSSKDKIQKKMARNDFEMMERQDLETGSMRRNKKEKRQNDIYSENRRRSRDLGSDDSPIDQSPKKSKDKIKYKNDDYAHEKIKSHTEAYYKKKQPHSVGDRRKRSSFTSMLDNKQRREEDGKENDAPKENMVNGDHKPSDAPAKMQRPSSAKGSRRRMEAPVTFTEGGNLSSDEDVPVQRQEPTLGDDDLPPQVTGRLARPSSARPAPPKRKEDTVNNEPAMRLGSGKPQNLILDDGKDSDEDETFVVEDAQPQHEEPLEQPTAPLVDDDDEDHGGLVKKIMESKKEYEQPRETKIDRPTLSDAQRRKQREAVQREIDKLRGSIQTLTRSANPLGKIMDYVQEDLDSMQKELEKWKEENKEHGLALKREKAITERAVEPLRVQLSEVDQAIKDQLDLIGAVKSNIIRNDQKIEKMLRTIAKS
ncbi:TRAF3-interacting protein 1-like isoform X2 [Mercenaria mercenaria]|uniref:TRAF3-interacting protein 1-like isoform X2 n=1 Tax=Mercenaria mercenaria TaxID=6596 RepID=UPI00234F95A4|nr:TRAF3-interacting protein 1-like isoform X2 [Mercenaria mercenaria]